MFDGIGGFPLAGVRYGFTPVWASEIESFPVKVTSLRFPEMLHVGDITKLKGNELIPVDVVCGGSPCQDLSVAGKRAGLQGARSSLFMEQIRVIKEMRAYDKEHGRTDDAVRPRYMVWENVPGAFSSAKGEDFRAVLEEVCRIADNNVSIPRPPRGVWRSAGAILGDQFSVAWRVYDTQYWPCTPQRRKRIYLVADFGGHTASQILFEQDRLFGDSQESEKAWQKTPTCSQASTADPGGSYGDLLNPWNKQQEHTLCLDAQGGPELFENHGIDSRYTGPHAVAPTMSASYGTGGNNVPLISQPIVCLEDSSKLHDTSFCIAGNIIDRQDHNGGNGLGVQSDISYTITSSDRHSVFNVQDSNIEINTYQRVVGALCKGDEKGISSQYVSQDKCIIGKNRLIRRLTPLECERLQGYPDFWTDIPGASDSARYKALGNSVAIPCVEHVLRGIAYFLCR